MTDEELVTHGFVVFPDDPTKAYCALYPTLSFRHRCDTCGIWSSLQGNDEKMECPQCFTGKKPFKPNKQSFKLYLCCDSDDCPIIQEAFALLRENGINPRWGSYDGFGGYIELDHLRTLPDEQRVRFYLAVNNITVSKYRARLLVHPGSKKKSKLPKTK